MYTMRAGAHSSLRQTTMAAQTHAQDLATQDRLTKNVKDLLWLNAFAAGPNVNPSDALAALKSKGPAADGLHGSNIAVILESLTKDAALASKAEEYGTVKFVTELSLEELMAGQLSGGEDTEEVLGWATGAKYDLKRPALFGV